MLDLVSFDRGRWHRDVVLGLGLMPASLVIILGGISISSLFVFGTAQPPALFRPLPLLPAMYAVLVFPLVWGLTEQMTYNGYLAPRIQVLSGSTGIAVALVSFAWSFQHVVQPLTFDPDFMLYRLLAPIPFSVFITLVYPCVRRLLPFAIAHWLMDGLLRSEIRSAHPEAIVDAIRPMREVVDRHLGPWRFAALLFSLLAAVAVIVAVIGLYALLAHQVADRTRETGIRIALGARNRHIVGFFALLTLQVVVVGLVTGVVAALIAGRSMTALLFGVTPADPLNYAIVSLVLLAAACAGVWLPIRRAITADPMLVLRRE